MNCGLLVLRRGRGNLRPDKSFGTYEKVSDDPLTVKYTVADDTKWSDGTAGRRGRPAPRVGRPERQRQHHRRRQGQERRGDRHAPEHQGQGLLRHLLARPGTGRGDPGDHRRRQVHHARSTPSRSRTGRRHGDERPGARRRPRRPSGIDDPQEAKDAFVKAIQDKDEAALDEDLHVLEHRASTSPRCRPTRTSTSPTARTDEGVQGEPVHDARRGTRTTRASTRPSIDKLTVRWNEDPMAQVQALQNGEIDMISPQVDRRRGRGGRGDRRRRDRDRSRGHLRARRPRAEQQGSVRPGHLRRRRREGQARSARRSSRASRARRSSTS